MDIDRLLDQVSALDKIYISNCLTNEFSSFSTLKVVTATIVGDTIKIMGENGNDIEIPIGIIKDIEFLEEEKTIIIYHDVGIVSLYYG